MSTDTMLSELLAFPPQPPAQVPLTGRQYELGVQSQIKFVEGLPTARLLGSVSGQDTLLDILDPSINSIPYLYALLAYARASKEGGVPDTQTKLRHYLLSFTTTFDPIQIRYCGLQFRQLLELPLKDFADDPTKAIVTVVTAMKRLDPTCSTLTSTHIRIIDTCLRKRLFSLALPLLSEDIYHLPSAAGNEYNYPAERCDEHAPSASFVNVKSGFTSSLTYQEYLTYFLYGASIYIACKQWRRALCFLEVVLAAPLGSGHVSMIQVEAYKRWSLVSILVHGRAGRTPRNMTQFASKQCNNVARAYSVLGEMFSQRDAKTLEAEIEAGPFKEDCNYSLALLVLAAHYRFAISNLSRIYTRLPLRDIPNLISRKDHTAKDTEALVSELIATGQLSARLISPQQEYSNTEETILEFVDPASSELSEDILLAEQVEQKRRIDILQERMTEARKRIELSKEYIANAAKTRKQQASKQDAPGRMDDEELLADDF